MEKNTKSTFDSDKAEVIAWALNNHLHNLDIKAIRECDDEYTMSMLRKLVDEGTLTREGLIYGLYTD